MGETLETSSTTMMLDLSRINGHKIFSRFLQRIMHEINFVHLNFPTATGCLLLPGVTTATGCLLLPGVTTATGCLLPPGFNPIEVKSIYLSI